MNRKCPGPALPLSRPAQEKVLTSGREVVAAACVVVFFPLPLFTSRPMPSPTRRIRNAASPRRSLLRGGASLGGIAAAPLLCTALGKAPSGAATAASAGAAAAAGAGGWPAGAASA